jgi:hypothetical protein
MRLRFTLPIVAAVLAAGAVGAAASSLGGLNGPSLGAASAAVGSCSQTGIGSDFILSATSVTGVTLTGLPAACVGQTVRVTVAGTAGVNAEATAQVSGATAVLALPYPVAVANVTSLSVVVTG